MKIFCFLLMMSNVVWATPKTEVFYIRVSDRKIEVNSPEKKSQIFSVIVENRSLTDQIGKFVAGDQTLKFVSVAAGKTESVDLLNKTSKNVLFVPISPAFQEVELVFGKKAYEIPPKE